MTPIVDAFIVAYLAAAWCWRLTPGTIGHAIVAPALAILRWAGFEQIWTMFAPDPPQASHVLRAVIMLRSGRAIVWEPPSMHGLPAWRALGAFRYREYASTMLSEAAAPCRPALIEYLLRKYDFGDDPPLHAFLVCERAPAAGPREGDSPAPAETLVVHGPAIGSGA